MGSVTTPAAPGRSLWVAAQRGAPHFGDCLLRVECGKRPPGPAAPGCRGPITLKILVGRAAPVCSACNNEACLVVKQSGRPVRLAA